MTEPQKRCTTCHLVRPLSDYIVRRAAPDGLQARCRTCSAAWYLANRAEHILRVRDRNNRVRAQHQERLAAYLLEHPCVDCGEDDLTVLDFDHEEPDEKAANVGRLVATSLPWTRVEREIAKCQVRCANCHRRRTAEMFGYWRSGPESTRRSTRQEHAEQRLAAILGSNAG